MDLSKFVRIDFCLVGDAARGSSPSLGPQFLGLGFRDWGLGFGVEGAGIRV